MHPLRAWLLASFREHADGLYEWSLRMLDAVEYETFNVPEAQWRGEAARALRHAMDACEAVGLSLEDHFPGSVMDWRRER